MRSRCFKIKQARCRITWLSVIAALLLLSGGALRTEWFWPIVPKSAAFYAALLGTPQVPPENRFLLIATYSYGPDIQRRGLIRNTTLRYGRQDPDAQVDHVFVLGKGPDWASEGQAEALMVEQSTHGDLLEVDCQENCLETGKTLLMYRRIYELFDPMYQLANSSQSARCSMGGFSAPLLTYDFVFKTDSDTVLHIPNIVKAIQDINSTRHLYFGSVYAPAFPYMEGGGYGMSWDLVNFIATDGWVEENKYGHIPMLHHPNGMEDELTGAWLHHGNMTDNLVDLRYRIANRQDEFKPPYDKWLFVHYAKAEGEFISNFEWLLAMSNHSALDETVQGPFHVALENNDRE